MKTLIRIAATGMAVLACSWAEETPASPATAAPVAAQASSWSLVYLPDLIWSEEEATQTVALLQQLKPDLVVSMAPCPFANTIRALECKPAVLDQTQRAKLGEDCSLPAISWSGIEDTSTLHLLGHGESGNAGLVWLSWKPDENRFIGPGSDGSELQSVARMQVRKHLAERHGEVVFLVNPSMLTPSDEKWNLPRKNVKYAQADSAVTDFTCIRPGSLQTEVAAINGVAPRVPVLHWIHSGANGMEWDGLPVDGGPAIYHSTATGATRPDDPYPSTVARLKSPPAPSEVPRWMDEYINNNPALGCGNNLKQGTQKRRFGWTDYGVTRENFQILRAGDTPLAEGKPKAWDLPRSMIRSPRNLFALELYDPADDGLEPSNGGDDGFNVYLNDLRTDKNVMLYFAGLSGAWPTMAAWFTDRYVITSGTALNDLDKPDDDVPSPRIHAQTLHLFDLQTGRSFSAASVPQPDDNGRSNAPTERIAFPVSTSGINVSNWRTLWKAIEDGYHAKPKPAPFTAEEVAANAKLPQDPGLQWKDLGIWPPPETWQLALEKEDPYAAIHDEKPVAGGDPYLTYTETADGQRHYAIAIAGHPDVTQFSAQDTITWTVAHADLITTGTGSLPQIGTIQRMGDDKRYLALAGTYEKPGGKESVKGKWMLLIDLLHHHSWSAHW